MKCGHCGDSDSLVDRGDGTALCVKCCREENTVEERTIRALERIADALEGIEGDMDTFEERGREPND